LRIAVSLAKINPRLQNGYRALADEARLRGLTGRQQLESRHKKANGMRDDAITKRGLICPIFDNLTGEFHVGRF
jgi:hypothetical protein